MRRRRLIRRWWPRREPCAGPHRPPRTQHSGARPRSRPRFRSRPRSLSRPRPRWDHPRRRRWCVRSQGQPFPAATQRYGALGPYCPIAAVRLSGRPGRRAGRTQGSSGAWTPSRSTTLPLMASVEECRAALAKLATSMSSADDETKRNMLDRTVSCYISDLDVTFTGRLANGQLVDITDHPDGPPREKAQVGLAMASDDLVALTDGRLLFVSAWLSGRVKVDASFRDLLRLRSLM